MKKPSPLPANATHLLLGQIVDAKASLKALHYDLRETRADLHDLQLVIANLEDDIDDLRSAVRRL